MHLSLGFLLEQYGNVELLLPKKSKQLDHCNPCYWQFCSTLKISSYFFAGLHHFLTQVLPSLLGLTFFSPYISFLKP